MRLEIRFNNGYYWRVLNCSTGEVLFVSTSLDEALRFMGAQ